MAVQTEDLEDLEDLGVQHGDQQCGRSLVATMEQAGVRRIFGIVGDSLNGLTEALRRRGKIEWIHVRHEEVAAFAAAGEADITGQLAVCAGSCGPGNLHLINGLFDAHRTRVPVLAIAAQIPSAEIGGGYFQETHPQNLFRECSHYCELISDASQLPYVMENAIRAAVGLRGVSVVAIPAMSHSAHRRGVRSRRRGDSHSPHPRSSPLIAT